MKRIPLTQDKEALVDDCDYSFLMKWQWCAVWRKKWYSHRWNGNNHTLNMHRTIADRLGFPQNIQIDHIDGDGLNNRRKNLRQATIAENLRNRGPNKNNTSGYKGVTKMSGGWLARIGVNSRRITLGMFDTATKAAEAYNKAAIQYHGEFAWLNPIKGK